MPLVIFEPPVGDVVEVRVRGDEALMDICDEEAAPVPFSCRSTTCGTCGVFVDRGASLLAPPGPAERALQRELGRDGRRFACAIRVRSGEGVIRLRVCGTAAGCAVPRVP